MDNLVFIFSLYIFYAIAGFLLTIFSPKIKDIYFLYILFLLKFLHFDFLGELPLTPFQIIIPVIFFSTLFRRNLTKDQKFNMIKQCWPFAIFLFVGFCWYLSTGLLPNYFAKSEYSSFGNFTIYYNFFSNFLLLLLPFYLKINYTEYLTLFRRLIILFIILSLLIILRSYFLPNIYIPLLLSVEDISTNINQVYRDGYLSLYTYYIIIFSLFFSNSKYKFLIIGLVFIINLALAGGRIDLVSSLFALFLYFTFVSSKNLNKSFINFFRFVLIVGIFFSLSSLFVSTNQANRFAELLNISQSAEFDTSRSNVRGAMWLYAFKGFTNSPIIGNGVSAGNKVYLFESVAARNVSIGGGHQTYLTVLYVFGLSGFIPFIIGLLKIVTKLNLIRNYIKSNLIYNFLYVFLLTEILLRFNLSGGIKNLRLLFYLFAGIILSSSIKNIKKNLS